MYACAYWPSQYSPQVCTDGWRGRWKLRGNSSWDRFSWFKWVVFPPPLQREHFFDELIFTRCLAVRGRWYFIYDNGKDCCSFVGSLLGESLERRPVSPWALFTLLRFWTAGRCVWVCVSMLSYDTFIHFHSSLAHSLTHTHLANSHTPSLFQPGILSDQMQPFSATYVFSFS